MKRYISILLLAAFCFLLSGCSSNRSVEVERPEEMPEMCQIGKMEFALPTNCTYYGEAEVEGSETVYPVSYTHLDVCKRQVTETGWP